ncbi:26S proteasome complex ubiquitin receptor, subunit Rpn13 [Niveomyces insectorum RCEF 264]|uniref:26S proteasome complex ubiquitin receptor, subunit Rpn13 n=1 Tax=Niveomyces insectorum RCEF 264 TaxID=1081102 RepID=A0A167YUV7_9HYPO|nr:26S proteasome complex ubiquitin receptor, subunit Rpn13 [Niveomyces insectorum RCEF 264]
MSIVPVITFKAGQCEADTSSRPHKVKALPEPGFIFLYAEDELMHFCWRPRSVPIDEAPLNLVMVPGDGHFEPYEGVAGEASSKTNGRIFVLKFESSSQRHLFWLQSKSQAASGDASWLSPRDRKIGELVDRLLQGDEPDINYELAQVRNNTDDSRRGDGEDDDDETMEDVEGHGDPNDPHGGSGAGSGATGGDVRNEGEDSREGGADGARAASSSAPDAATVVRNLLASLSGQQGFANDSSQAGKAYPQLNDLLETSVTIPMIRSASEDYLDSLLNYLPPAVLILSQNEAGGGDDGGDLVEPTAEAAAAAKAAMNTAEKKNLLEKVLRSPQFSQSLASLSMALRDGGLPSIADALAIPVKNQGFLPGGAMPMGGGDAVEAFVEGVKAAVQEKLAKQGQ